MVQERCALQHPNANPGIKPQKSLPIYDRILALMPVYAVYWSCVTGVTGPWI